MTISTPPPTFSSQLKLCTFSCNDRLPLRSDILWRIERGAVRALTWSEEGTQIILGLWGPGDVVGRPLSRIEPYEMQCLTNVEASLLPSHLWHRLLDLMCLHIQQAEELLSIVRRERANQRLLAFLNWLGQKFGRRVEQGLLIDLRLTHQQIGEAIGVTRVTITRLLNQFEQEGIICRHRHYLILCLSDDAIRTNHS